MDKDRQFTDKLREIIATTETLFHGRTPEKMEITALEYAINLGLAEMQRNFQTVLESNINEALKETILNIDFKLLDDLIAQLKTLKIQG